MLMFFSFALGCLLGNVFSETQPTEFTCSAASENNGTYVGCFSTKYGEGVLLSADFLRQLNVSDDKTKTTYLLSEYPHPITSFTIHKAGGIKIEENALKALPKLISLWLESRDGNITIPSEEFKNTLNLKRLRVRRGAIPESTLQAIRSAPKLEYLQLYLTKVGELKSDSLRGLVNLHTLELNHNGFSTIEEGTFDGLTELTELSIYGNNISSITASLPKDSSKMKSIKFRDNAISTIPKSAFSKYKQLTQMSLYENPITKLENGVFEGLENLDTLFLHMCPIDQLPESDLQKMKKLTVFSLDQLMISKVNSTTFKGLRKLTELLLSDCKVLRTIEPGSFDDLVSVTFLSLRGNPNLKELPDGLFKNMKMLLSVNLVETCVQNLSLANFTHCPNFQSLDMGDCVAGSNGTSR